MSARNITLVLRYQKARFWHRSSVARGSSRSGGDWSLADQPAGMMAELSGGRTA